MEQRGLKNFITRYPLVIVIALTALLYSKTLSYNFTHLDDKQLIVDNYKFISNISNIPKVFQDKVFTGSYIPYYRPLLTLSFMLDAQLGGMAPAVYHCTNLILHCIVILLVFHMLLMMGTGRDTALFLTAVFAVHPALSETVAWIPGRNDLLLAVCALSCCMLFFRYIRTGRFIFYLAHVALFLAALFTKENAIVLVPILAVMLYWRPDAIKTRGRDACILIVWCVFSALWLLIRSAALVYAYRTPISGMAGALLVSAPALVQFIGKSVFPFNLSVFPTIKDTTFFYGIAAILAVGTALVVSKSKDPRRIFIGFIWYIGFLVMTFIRPSHELVLDFQEHRLYVPLVGFLLVLGEVGWLRTLDLRKKIVRIICGAVILVFAVITFAHIDVFKDRFTYWADAVKATPRLGFTHLNVGFIYYETGLYDAAESEYRKALEIDPDLPNAHFKLGLLYLDKKMYSRAEREFKDEIRVHHNFDYGFLSLGVAYYKQGKDVQAERAWLQALKSFPYNTDAMKNLAIYYAEKGNAKKARYYACELQKYGMTPPPDFLKKIGA